MATKDTGSKQPSIRNSVTDGQTTERGVVRFTEGVLKKGGLGVAPTSPKPTSIPGQKPVPQQTQTSRSQQPGSSATSQNKTDT